MQTELKLLLLAFAWGLYYFLHSFLATDACKAWGRSRLGQKKYRLLYNLWSCIGIVVLLFGLMRLDKIILWPSFLPMQILAFLLIAAGLLLGYRAMQAYDLGEFSGLGNTVEDHTPLVVEGLNAYVRHPLYSAILLLGFGIVFLLPWDTLWVTLGITVVYVFWGSHLEEQKLIKRYGEAYLSYREKVNRFIPNFL